MQTSNKPVLIVILLISVTLQPACGQTAFPEQINILEQLGLYPYPSPEMLTKNVFDSSGFIVAPLSDKDIQTDFTNLDDLAWLAPVTKDQRVVLVGEEHHYQYIQHLRNRILFALNTFDSYPSVILEHPYSSTPFWNYYLAIDDDGKAWAFAQEIQDFFIDASDYQLLQHLRRWNSQYPHKKIQVGCSDIEHDYPHTFQQILLPYFVRLEHTDKSARAVLLGNVAETISTLQQHFKRRDLSSPEELYSAFQPIEQFVECAKEQRLIGNYPFLTPEYIETVIENLKSSYNAKTQDFFKYRQQAIIRNLTDTHFLGTYFITGKVMIHGGRYHTPTHVLYPMGENFLREGSYLTYEFVPTKGRTYSINVSVEAWSSLLEVKKLREGNLDLRRRLQQTIEQGQLVSEEPYICTYSAYRGFDVLDEFTKTLYQLADQQQRQPFLVQTVPWDSLIRQAQAHSPAVYESLLETFLEFKHHDAQIVIPISPLVNPKIGGE